MEVLLSFGEQLILRNVRRLCQGMESSVAGLTAGSFSAGMWHLPSHNLSFVPSLVAAHSGSIHEDGSQRCKACAGYRSSCRIMSVGHEDAPTQDWNEAHE